MFIAASDFPFVNDDYRPQPGDIIDFDGGRMAVVLTDGKHAVYLTTGGRVCMLEDRAGAWPLPRVLRVDNRYVRATSYTLIGKEES
jgi:hypothetical protein